MLQEVWFFAIGVCILLLSGGGIVTWLILYLSLPKEDGIVHVSGLRSSVKVERDCFGVPTIIGRDRRDVSFALGFVHAQERFFQMDILRRRAAGQLAELLGKSGIASDKKAREYRFRLRVEAALDRLPSEEREILRYYAEGVNEGMRCMKGRPFEYYLLLAKPQRWVPEDSLLVICAMADSLGESSRHRKLGWNALCGAMSKVAANFFAPTTSSWDAPLIDESYSSPASIPSQRDLDFGDEPWNSSTEEAGGGSIGMIANQKQWVGSNCWVAGSLKCEECSAILANDPHLDLSVPNIWFKMALQWGDQRNYVCGVTIPGVPIMVIGSNRHIAWGLTASAIDSDDLIFVRADHSGNNYWTDNGWRRVESESEEIAVKGAKPVRLTFQTTQWGRVIGRSSRGDFIVLRQLVDEAIAIDIKRIDLETAKTTDEAIEIAKQGGLPALNFFVADRCGKIGWTITGPIPRRSDSTSCSGQLQTKELRAGCYAENEYPEVVGDTIDYIWNGNNRMLTGEAAAKLGDGGYDLGARAKQIRDDLRQLKSASIDDMLAIQLDNRADFLEHWYRQLTALLDKPEVSLTRERTEFRRELSDWSGKATTSSVSYRLVREYRDEVATAVFAPVVKVVSRSFPEFDYRMLRYEDPLWAMVQAKPLNLLNRCYASWDELLLSAVDRVIERVRVRTSRYRYYTVGDRNATRIENAISKKLPFFSLFLNMPRQELPGDWSDMPRIQCPSYGASMRMAVSAGKEESGYLILPCGQSANPLSAHYRDLHAQWVSNVKTPFLPGRTIHTLELKPRQLV